MLYLSVIMGGLVAMLTDYWLGRAAVKDPARLIIAVAVGVLVAVFTYTGDLAHF